MAATDRRSKSGGENGSKSPLSRQKFYLKQNRYNLFPVVKGSPSSANYDHRSLSSMALSLIDILSNEYLLLSTTPYLLPHELLGLALCSRSYHLLITQSRSVWRHLDLSANSRKQNHYGHTRAQISTPLYRAYPSLLLSKPFVLRDVKTLVLDELPVSVGLLNYLLSSSSNYKIQILSIRGCHGSIDDRMLRQLFVSLAQESFNTIRGPTLKGCYYFGDQESPSPAYQHPILHRFVSAHSKEEWVETLLACQGIFTFDLCLCSGSRHHDGQPAKIARVWLKGDCAGCGKRPEEDDHKIKSLSQGVLVPPVPLMSSDLKAACSLDTIRCEECMTGRWCERCRKWWCEECMSSNTGENCVPFVSVNCYDCGSTCVSCNRESENICNTCNGGYCTIHNEGHGNNFCDWCNSERRTTRVYRQPHQHSHNHPHLLPPQLQPQSQQEGSSPSAALLSYAHQQRLRTIARLNAIRSSLRFVDGIRRIG